MPSIELSQKFAEAAFERDDLTTTHAEVEARECHGSGEYDSRE